MELLDQGYEVDIYESRPFIGGKVASWQKDGNHVEMGLHVVSVSILFIFMQAPHQTSHQTSAFEACISCAF